MKERLTALVLRHGEASANAMGIFRSWLDVPLTDRGKKQAEEARDFLKSYPIEHIICSPLLRAFVTACVAAEPHKIEVFQHRGLFPWRLGVFSGLDKRANEDALHLFALNPDVTIPAGESLNDFEDRQFAFWSAALKMAAKNGLTLYVCHNSAITALAKFLSGDETVNPVAQENVKPGGVAEIYFDGKYHRLEPVFGTPEPARFGGS